MIINLDEMRQFVEQYHIYAVVGMKATRIELRYGLLKVSNMDEAVGIAVREFLEQFPDFVIVVAHAHRLELSEIKQ